MDIKHGCGTTEYGPGIDIKLTGDEVAAAIYAYVDAHHIEVHGPATVLINGKVSKGCKIYVDPEGYVIHDGKKTSGRG